MATHLANTPNIKVPDYFAVAIERVMWNKFRFFARAIYRRKVAHLSTVRKTFSERIASAGGKINVASDGRHQFLVEVLEKVRGVLKPSMEAGVFNIGEPRKPAPAADRARDPFRNMFSILGVYQPSESFLDAPDVVKPQVSAPQYVAESDGSLEEAVFALTALFDDYQSLREELSSLWAMYRAGNRDLAAVSLATNTAFEFARSMEDDIKPIMEGRAARAFCWKSISMP